MDTSCSTLICVLSLLLSCLLTVRQVSAVKRDAELYCGACQALVDEIEFAIGEVDPKKTIEMGFRIDPQGRQKVKKIPFAGSEVHLLDEMESVCGKLKDYAERVDPETKIKTFVRFNARNDKDTLELTHVSINAGISKALEVACQNIIEEHEEEIIQSITSTKLVNKENICREITGVCSESEETESAEKSEL
ncbi:protein canopy homolog 2-like [Asterias rubens]|uniref:protein canopy homolog 2-like n=1 Tax=Asterias rubens TaxID=7604 RepID=UPI001455C16D|nr:protein canopy homolog 2-like [Asterias rubens]XP_033624890.1 protein canopy homolog 2-like [Asterias rubens]